MFKVRARGSPHAGPPHGDGGSGPVLYDPDQETAWHRYANWNTKRRSLLILEVAVWVMALSACSHDERKVMVIGIDRTGVARTSGWAGEVATVTSAAVDAAFVEGIEELHLIGIGSNMNATSRVARADLRLDCPNEHRCEDDRKLIRNQVADAAGRVAAMPVRQTGTALIEAIQTAVDICAGRSCQVILITDGQDSRLHGAESVDQLISQIQPTLPKLTGITLRLVGLGADDSSPQSVARAEKFWTRLLRGAGATDVRIGRSL